MISSLASTRIPYFFDQMPWLPFFFAVCFSAATTQGWLLFEGGVYSLVKLVDSMKVE